MQGSLHCKFKAGMQFWSPEEGWAANRPACPAFEFCHSRASSIERFSCWCLQQTSAQRSPAGWHESTSLLHSSGFGISPNRSRLSRQRLFTQAAFQVLWSFFQPRQGSDASDLDRAVLLNTRNLCVCFIFSDSFIVLYILLGSLSNGFRVIV